MGTRTTVGGGFGVAVISPSITTLGVVSTSVKRVESAVGVGLRLPSVSSGCKSHEATPSPVRKSQQRMRTRPDLCEAA